METKVVHWRLLAVIIAAAACFLLYPLLARVVHANYQRTGAKSARPGAVTQTTPARGHTKVEEPDANVAAQR